MRGIRNILNTFRHVRSNRAFVAGFFAMASMVTGVGVHQFN